MALNVVQIFFFIIRLALLIALVVFFMYAYSMTLTISAEREAERVNIEMAENIFSSGLTTNRTVFDVEKLEEFDKSTKEPFVRNCKYGYYLKIGDLEALKYWEFGYQAGNKLTISEVKKEYPVTLSYSYGYIAPGLMVLSVYDTWITRITCMIEKAQQTGVPQKLYIESKVLVDINTVKRDANTPEKICLEYKGVEDCRQVSNDVLSTSIGISYDMDKTQIDPSRKYEIIEAVPVSNTIRIRLQTGDNQ